jgi:hypothetical protein
MRTASHLERRRPLNIDPPALSEDHAILRVDRPDEKVVNGGRSRKCTPSTFFMT